MPAALSRPSSRRWPPSYAPRKGNTRESEGAVPVNLALGHVSNDFLIAALVIYSLSVVAFAGDFAFGRPRRAAWAGGRGRGAGRGGAPRRGLGGCALGGCPRGPARHAPGYLGSSRF